MVVKLTIYFNSIKINNDTILFYLYILNCIQLEPNKTYTNSIYETI